MCSYLPLYAAYRAQPLLSAGWGDLIVQGVFQGVLLGAVSIFTYTRAVAILGAAETALFTDAVPCITNICAIPLLSEWPSMPVIVGVVAVTMGMAVAMRSRN